MELYVSDLDGTLLNSRQEICLDSIKIINELIDEGLNFTIATARSWESVKDIVAPLNLKLPFILANGALIYDPIKGENIVANLIEPSMFDTVMEACNSLNLHPMVFTITPGGEYKAYYREVSNCCMEGFIREREEKGDNRFTLIDAYHICTKDAIYSFAFSVEKDTVDDLCERLKGKMDLLVHYHEDVYYPGYCWLEIAHRNANKKFAAEYLKEYTGANKLICFGDNLNDCSMFEAADYKYAVRNANEALKKYATGIIGSNDESGVARFLQSVFQKGERYV
ncbi:MAG: Cof-type HAD-IIB family hydrolase [Clostridia bacterium]|nr:Cof-type HAD-IIB family hydrolase [Clostridia bacterium]